MGTLYHKSLSLVATGGLSYTEQVALQDEVQARRAEAAQLRAQIMLEQVAAKDASWQRHGNDDTELLIRPLVDETGVDLKELLRDAEARASRADDLARQVDKLRMELKAVQADNVKLLAAIDRQSSQKDDTNGQELKERVESWKDDGWLEQCCASLAEQLRIAQAENAELQQEVEALRGESSSEQSSPMAWDGTRQGSANFEAALEMETSSQGSRGSRLSRPRTSSWTSQRNLEAQVAALQHQLDLSAATQIELQKEIELLRMEGGAEAVEAAVAVAVAAKEGELAAVQRHSAELESHLEAVLEEAQHVQEECLAMSDAIVQLEAALRDSESKREMMLQEKRMLEQQLLETAGDVAVAERELTGSQLGGLGGPGSAGRASSMSYSSDSDDSTVDVPSGSSTPRPRRSHISRLAEASVREVEALRAENDTLMKELVEKKMELAELHEELITMHHKHARADVTKKN